MMFLVPAKSIVTGPRAERAGAPTSPPAARGSRRSAWRDPRLAVGVAIVAVSVLVGAGVLAAADDTTSVWAAGTDLRAGAQVRTDDLVVREVRFTAEEQAAAYVPGGSDLPAGATLARDVLAGELLPRAALSTGRTEDLVEVPLAVPAESVVASLRVGETVDVWVTPDVPVAGAGDDPAPAERVLSSVRVLAVPRAGTALGPAATRQVVVGVPADEEGLLGRALARLASGAPVVVRRS